MKNIIQQLTETYYEQLPQNDFYKLENFGSYGYPDFLIRHLQYRLNAKVKSQLKIPSAQWVNRNADEVQQTKQLFINALLNEARLPADSVYDFIKKSVGEVLEMLIQPRQNIPKILFGDKAILSKEELEKRVKLITVYQHFGQVLTGYMNRKKRSELTKDQCKKIITNVDEKLTQTYSPQQWAQLLNPLFVLTSDHADSQPFRLFFEDKKMKFSATAFERAGGELSRDDFIEILTSVNSFEQDKGIRNVEPIKKSNFSPPPPVADDGNERAGGESSYYKASEGEKPKNKNKESSLAKTMEKRRANEANEAVAEKDEDSSINTKFSESKNQKKSLIDLFATEKTEEQEDKEEIKQVATKPVPTQPTFEKEVRNENNDIPIWQRFTADDKSDSSLNDAVAIEEKKNATNQNDNNAQQETLNQYLADRQQVFIDNLFNGSKNDYEKGITKIEGKSTWQDAANTLRDDIFDKHNINIYSPAAVTFTDRLQDYFEKKS